MRAAIDGVSFRVEPVTGHEPAKGRLGRLALITAKDRHGQFKVSEKSVNVTIEDVDGGTQVLMYRNAPGEENLTDAAEVFRLICLGCGSKRKINDKLKEESDNGTGWSDTRILSAIQVLEDGGYVARKGNNKQAPLERVADFSPRAHRERTTDRLLGVSDDHAA
jgi:hypothetical protein